MSKALQAAIPAVAPCDNSASDQGPAFACACGATPRGVGQDKPYPIFMYPMQRLISRQPVKSSSPYKPPHVRHKAQLSSFVPEGEAHYDR